MKHLALLSLFTLHFSLFTLSTSAAVPLKWTVETSRAVPAQFEAYQGETLAFEAALQSYGKPLEAPSEYSLYWQTNGMGNAWWSVPCTNNQAPGTNILIATWSPTNDVGARAYNCFIGKPGTIYHAAFQLRLRPSPGAHPNDLPLPQPVIDFARVTVLNPPWSGGGGGGVDTNAVRDIIHEQLVTNGIRSVDGAARPLPKYLHVLDFDDCYTNEAAWYYDEVKVRGEGEQRNFTSTVHLGPSPSPNFACSAVRKGNLLGRNYDWTYDEMAEFVVRVSAAANRHASVGVANVGTNLTEQFVTSGKFSPLYRVLPGRTVDGINDAGVVAEVNVIPRDAAKDPAQSATRNLHPFEVVRYVLDNFDSASNAAHYVAAHYYIPAGSPDSYHWMIADKDVTYVVEDGAAVSIVGVVTMTNHRLFVDYDKYGSGFIRESKASQTIDLGGTVADAIEDVMYTNAYAEGWPWPDEFAGQEDAQGKIPYDAFDRLRAWADAHVAPLLDENRKPAARGNGCWQTVHSAIYDFEKKTMAICVQEDFSKRYVFAVDQANVDLTPIEAQIAELQSGKLDSDDPVLTATAPSVGASETSLAGAKATGEALDKKADEFTEWEFSGEDYDPALTYRITVDRASSVSFDLYDIWKGDEDSPLDTADVPKSTEPTVISESEWRFGSRITATRRRVLYTGDAATPQDLDDAISATNPTFSNAVLAVGLNIDTNSVAVLNEIAATFGDFPVTGTATTVGGLLAALAAAVAWLRKRAAHIDGNGFGDNDFATDLLGKNGAKEKVKEIIANKVLPVTGDSSLTKTIATICGKAIKAPEGGGNGFFVVMSDYNNVSSGGASLTVGDLMFIQDGTERSIKKLPNTEILKEGNKKFEPFAVPIPASGTVELADDYGGYVLKNNVEVPTGTCSVADGDVFLLHGCFCLPFDTPILMSDGSMRRICDIRVGDLVMSINPETGAREADCVVFCDGLEDKRHGVKDVWHFDDGSVIETVHRHRIYNVDLDEPMYMEAWNVGERCYRDDGSTPRLVSHERLHGDWRHCTIFTKKWNNYFANGILCGNRNSSKLTVGV